MTRSSKRRPHPRRPAIGALAVTAALLLAPPGRAGEIRPGLVAPPTDALSLIAFGSCAHQDRPQPIWEAVIATDPDLFVFLGDNVYANSRRSSVIEAAYRTWETDHPGFTQLRERIPLLATWDDHDYGGNDAGADFPAREDSERIFLDFWGEAAAAPRRTRPGIFDAQVFGPPGRRVQLILLDTRSFRSALEIGVPVGTPATGRPGSYDPERDAGATMLGEAQWAWLDEQLAKPAELRLIVSSVQVLAEDHRFERWANLPRERERLFDRIACSEANGVVFLSGDRHHAELSRLPAEGRRDDLTDEHTGNPVGYPLLDITASSLNVPRPWQNEINRHRLGTMYFGPNYGSLSIDWDEADPTIRVVIHDVEGEAALEHELNLSSLRASRRNCSDRRASDP